MEPEEVALHMNKSYSLLDVRRKSETDVGYVQGSEFITLAELEEHTDEVPEGKFLIMCAVGYRSMIAASLLKARGIHRFKIVLGGYSNVKKEKNLILEESKFELL